MESIVNQQRELHHGIKRKSSSDQVIDVSVSQHIAALKVLMRRRPSCDLFYERVQELLKELKCICEHGIAESEYESVQHAIKVEFATLDELSRRDWKKANGKDEYCP